MAELDLGDYYSMSTLSPIADYGKSLQKRAAVERALKNRAPINIGQGVLYDPSSRESSVSQAYQDQLASKREHEMGLANTRLERTNQATTTKREQKLADDKLRRENQLADQKTRRKNQLIDQRVKAEQKKTPSPKTKNDLAKLQTVIGEGNEMLFELEENPDTIERWWDIPAAAARELGANTIGNILESSMKSPEELSVKQRLNTFVAKVRHSLSGAALTQMERALGEAYLPNATGISQAEASERLRNMVSYLESEHNLTAENYDFSDPVIGGNQESDLDRQIRELEEELGQ